MTFDQDSDPDRRRLLAQYDREMRLGARPDGTGAVVEATGRVVRQTSPPPGWNAVLWSGLDESTADAEIAAQVAHYAALDGGAGRPFEWKLYAHDGPTDLGARLAAAGLEPGEPETLMVARVADLPREPELAPGLRLVAVTDAAGVALMEEVHDRAFGAPRPDLAHQILTQLTERPDTIAAVVALAATPDGERPVSAARLEMTPGTAFAGLWGGGTVAEWRGRGIYRALVAYRAAIAAARGIPYLQVDASPMSRPILERLGFTPLTTTREYNWAPNTPSPNRTDLEPAPTPARTEPEPEPEPARTEPEPETGAQIMTTERIGPPLTGGERETLRAFLDYHRATLAMKCEGLTDEELRRRSMPPSTLSLLGLVRHMAEVERTWFRRTMNGEDLPLRWSAEGDYQAAYDATGATRAEAFAAWEEEVAHARRIEQAAESLDVTAHNKNWDEDVSLRLVMLHLIHEYARHNGHADFLREGIDGTVGA